MNYPPPEETMCIVKGNSLPIAGGGQGKDPKWIMFSGILLKDKIRENHENDRRMDQDEIATRWQRQNQFIAELRRGRRKGLTQAGK